MKGINPPTTLESDKEWRTHKSKTFSLNLDWSKNWEEINKQVGEGCELDFIYLGIEDLNENVLFREDYYFYEINKIL